MKSETIYWIIIPAIISAFILFQSTANSIKSKTLTSWLLTSAIWMTIVFSGIKLGNMYFHESWYSFFPHMLISLSILLLLLQTILNKTKNEFKFDRN